MAFISGLGFNSFFEANSCPKSLQLFGNALLICRIYLALSEPG
jgi:hypothetical protein